MHCVPIRKDPTYVAVLEDTREMESIVQVSSKTAATGNSEFSYGSISYTLTNLSLIMNKKRLVLFYHI